MKTKEEVHKNKNDEPTKRNSCTVSPVKKKVEQKDEHAENSVKKKEGTRKKRLYIFPPLKIGYISLKGNSTRLQQIKRKRKYFFTGKRKSKTQGNENNENRTVRVRKKGKKRMERSKIIAIHKIKKPVFIKSNDLCQ